MLHHKGTQEIKTHRLILRRYKLSDAQYMYKNYATDKRVTRFLNWEPYSCVEDVETFVNDVITSYEKPDTYHWAIIYEGEIIGAISAWAINEQDCNCEVGYNIGYDYWNKGIMTEALTAVIRYLFDEVKMHRILAKHDVDNPASGKVMQKCGMKREGIFRQYYLHEDGTYSDSVLYSILENER